MEKKIFFSCLFVVMCFSIRTTAQTQFNFHKNKIVVLDPGHGGKDPGAIGINGERESDTTLRLAKELLNLNNKVGYHEIYLTRYADTLISLGDRVALAETLKAELFISLHFNHSTSSTARGIEIFVSPGIHTAQRTSAILLAHRIHTSLAETTGFFARGVKFKNFQVLKETIQEIPSILIEICFLSNPDEAKFLRNEESLKRVAEIILYSI
ncbi:MAG TPA: N-acetylmuramoyl-L-alanine amidase [Gillisia sp.]|nr:N-acetylmuramoyl-L-alanine amidase [Gillisia sp.]